MADHNDTNTHQKSAEFEEAIYDPELEARLYAEIYFSNETYEDVGSISESHATENRDEGLLREAEAGGEGDVVNRAAEQSSDFSISEKYNCSALQQENSDNRTADQENNNLQASELEDNYSVHTRDKYRTGTVRPQRLLARKGLWANGGDSPQRDSPTIDVETRVEKGTPKSSVLPLRKASERQDTICFESSVHRVRSGLPENPSHGTKHRSGVLSDNFGDGHSNERGVRACGSFVSCLDKAENFVQRGIVAEQVKNTCEGSGDRSNEAERFSVGQNRSKGTSDVSVPFINRPVDTVRIDSSGNQKSKKRAPKVSAVQSHKAVSLKRGKKGVNVIDFIDRLVELRNHAEKEVAKPKEAPKGFIDQLIEAANFPLDESQPNDISEGVREYINCSAPLENSSTPKSNIAKAQNTSGRSTDRFSPPKDFSSSKTRSREASIASRGSSELFIVPNTFPNPRNKAKQPSISSKHHETTSNFPTPYYPSTCFGTEQTNLSPAIPSPAPDTIFLTPSCRPDPQSRISRAQKRRERNELRKLLKDPKHVHLNLETSKYSVVSKKNKLKMKKKQSEPVQISSDSDDSILEVPVPPKAPPPVIQLQDSDDESPTILEAPSESPKKSNNKNDAPGPSAISFTEENAEPSVLSVPSPSSGAPAGRSNVNEPSEVILESQGLIMNVTELQRGAASLEEIRRSRDASLSTQHALSDDSMTESEANNWKSLEDRRRNAPGVEETASVDFSIDEPSETIWQPLQSDQQRSASSEPRTEASSSLGETSDTRTTENLGRSEERRNENLASTMGMEEESSAGGSGMAVGGSGSVETVSRKRRKDSSTGNRREEPESPAVPEKRARAKVRTGKDLSMTEYFFKPMSKELQAFYNKPWDGEHADLVQIQSKMPKNPNCWMILDADLQSPAGKRRMVCPRCKTSSHFGRRCPEKAKPPCCYMCGTKGHTESRCPHSMCLTCGRKYATYRPTCSHCSRLHCTMCNGTGHSSENCPDLWRRYHNTTTESLPNVPRDVFNIMKPTQNLTCCNCAKRGHDVSNCRQLRWSQHFSTPMNISSYTVGPFYEIETPQRRPEATRTSSELQEASCNRFSSQEPQEIDSQAPERERLSSETLHATAVDEVPVEVATYPREPAASCRVLFQVGIPEHLAAPNYPKLRKQLDTHSNLKLQGLIVGRSLPNFLVSWFKFFLFFIEIVEESSGIYLTIACESDEQLYHLERVVWQWLMRTEAERGYMTFEKISHEAPETFREEMKKKLVLLRQVQPPLELMKKISAYDSTIARTSAKFTGKKTKKDKRRLSTIIAMPKRVVNRRSQLVCSLYSGRWVSGADRLIHNFKRMARKYLNASSFEMFTFVDYLKLVYFYNELYVFHETEELKKALESAMASIPEGGCHSYPTTAFADSEEILAGLGAKESDHTTSDQFIQVRTGFSDSSEQFGPVQTGVSGITDSFGQVGINVEQVGSAPMGLEQSRPVRIVFPSTMDETMTSKQDTLENSLTILNQPSRTQIEDICDPNHMPQTFEAGSNKSSKHVNHRKNKKKSKTDRKDTAGESVMTSLDQSESIQTDSPNTPDTFGLSRTCVNQSGSVEVSLPNNPGPPGSVRTISDQSKLVRSSFPVTPNSSRPVRTFFNQQDLERICLPTAPNMLDPVQTGLSIIENRPEPVQTDFSTAFDRFEPVRSEVDCSGVSSRLVNDSMRLQFADFYGSPYVPENRDAASASTTPKQKNVKKKKIFRKTGFLRDMAKKNKKNYLKFAHKILNVANDSQSKKIHEIAKDLKRKIDDFTIRTNDIQNLQNALKNDPSMKTNQNGPAEMGKAPVLKNAKKMRKKNKPVPDKAYYERFIRSCNI